MKVTIEELKGLNVEAYIDWLIDAVDKAYFAYAELPVLEKEKNRLILSQFEAFVAVTSGIHDNHSETPNTSTDEQIEAIKKKITALDKDLQTAVDLADEKVFIKSIGEYDERVRSKDNSIASRIQQIDTDTEAPTISAEDFGKITHLHDVFLETGWEYKNETPAYKCAETLDFDYITSLARGMRDVFCFSLDSQLEQYGRMQKFNANAAATALKEATEIDFKYIDCVLNASICKEFILDPRAALEFASLAYYSHIANENSKESTHGTPHPLSITKTQFTELAKALILAGVLKYDTEKQAVYALSKAFQIPIEKQEFDRILQKIKGRKDQEEAIFIDGLKRSLTNWINNY